MKLMFYMIHFSSMEEKKMKMPPRRIPGVLNHKFTTNFEQCLGAQFL